VETIDYNNEKQDAIKQCKFFLFNKYYMIYYTLLNIIILFTL